MAKKFLKEKNIEKDIKGGRDGRPFIPAWDEQREYLYGVEAFHLISKRLKSNWENSAQEKNPKERIPLQQRIVQKYKEELRANLYNFIYEVEHLCNTDKQMGLDDYYGELVPEIERLFDEGKDEQSLWHKCIDVMHDLLNNFGGSYLIFREGKFFRSVRVDKELDETGHYTKDYLYNFYDLYCGELAFRVCRLVEEWYFIYTSSIVLPDAIDPEDEYFEEESGEMPFLSGREIATYAEAACLYIALQNEQNKLEEEAELYGIPLEKETKPTKPEQQQQNKKQKTDDALTPEVKRIFDAAVEDGRFMKKTHTGYEWIFEDGSPTKLCFFLLEVYKRQSPPWEQLQTLFARKEIFKTLSNQLKGRNWYREGKLGKWAKEIRDFVQSMKPTDEATPVKQKQPTTPTQTPPPVRQMTTEEAFNWMESLRPNSN